MSLSKIAPLKAIAKTAITTPKKMLNIIGPPLFESILPHKFNLVGKWEK